MHIHLIRTRYPHWCQYSGIYQFVKYVDPQQYMINVRVASDSDEDFPIKDKFLQKWLRHQVQAKGMEWYKLSDLTAEAIALKECWRRKIDVIHYLDGEHSAQFLPKLLKRFNRIRPKIVATYHQPPELLDTLIDKQVISQLDSITVVCPEQAAYFEKFVDPSKIHSILHGIDTHYFKPSNLPKKQENFKCLTVGRWLRDYEALRRVAKALISYKNIEFHIVTGNAQELQDLENVTVHRGISDLELLKLYQQSHVLLLPLQQSTANNALLEGIACGLPVISTDLASVRAYLPGEEAILIQNNDAEQFIEALINLMNNPTQVEAMSLAARSRAEKLSWENIAPYYENIYSKPSG